MKPRIGITSSVNKRDYESEDRDVVMLPWNYPSIVEECGGLPLILSEGGDPDACIDAIDALIIAGGRDIDPATYGHDSLPETNDVRRSQDLWELGLIDSAKKRGLPILASAEGTSLWQSHTEVFFTSISLPRPLTRNMAHGAENGLNMRSP